MPSAPRKAPGLELREGEVPFGFTDEEWAEQAPAVLAAAAVRMAGEREAAARADAAWDRAQLPRKPLLGLSPSSANAFRQCARRFEFERILGRDSGPPSVAAVLGQFIHKVGEWLASLDLGDRNAEAAKELTVELWRLVTVGGEEDSFRRDAASGPDIPTMRSDLQVLALPDPEILKFKRDAWRGVLGVVEMEQYLPGKVYYFEEDVSCVIDCEYNGVMIELPFRGRIDRADLCGDSSLMIIDYKSGAVPNSVEAEAEKADQLLWYTPAVEETLDMEVSAAALIFVGEERVMISVDLEGVDEAWGRFVGIWMEMLAAEETKSYPANPGWLCGWCPHFEDCPEGTGFLVDKLGWMASRARKFETGEDRRPPPPVWVEILGWSPARREAWEASATSV